jgi:hypothetical protein
MLSKVETLDFSQLERDGPSEEAVVNEQDKYKAWGDMIQRVQ